MGEVRFKRGMCQAIMTSLKYVILLNRALLNRDPHCNETTETIIASYWSEHSTYLSVFWNLIHSLVHRV